MVARSASHNPETKKVVSYDIMCQWGLNLRKRLKGFPLENAERLDDHIVARVVPKFHLAAHKETCRVNFSLNYEPGVGRSDMEGPERTWFGLQGGGTTKDQGPGYWSDAMDDKFGHWNWTKLVRLGIVTWFSFLLRYPNIFTQARSSPRNIPTPSHRQQYMKTNSPLSVLTSRRNFLTRGRQKSLRGRLTEVAQTHTLTPPLVRRTAHPFRLSLISQRKDRRSWKLGGA